MDQTFEQAISDVKFGYGSHYIYFGPDVHGAVYTRLDVTVVGTFSGPEPLATSPLAVPEASTMSMLLVGMACLAGWRARQARRR